MRPAVWWEDPYLPEGGEVMPDQKPATDKPVRPRPPKTPLIERLGLLRSQLQGQVDFLRWLDAKGRLTHLNPWNPEDWVAEFQGFDMDEIAEERKAVTDYAARMQVYWRDLDVWRAAKEGGK